MPKKKAGGKKKGGKKGGKKKAAKDEPAVDDEALAAQAEAAMAAAADPMANAAPLPPPVPIGMVKLLTARHANPETGVANPGRVRGFSSFRERLDAFDLWAGSRGFEDVEDSELYLSSDAYRVLSSWASGMLKVVRDPKCALGAGTEEEAETAAAELELCRVLVEQLRRIARMPPAQAAVPAPGAKHGETYASERLVELDGWFSGMFKKLHPPPKLTKEQQADCAQEEERSSCAVVEKVGPSPWDTLAPPADPKCAPLSPDAIAKLWAEACAMKIEGDLADDHLGAARSEFHAFACAVLTGAYQPPAPPPDPKAKAGTAAAPPPPKQVSAKARKAAEQSIPKLAQGLLKGQEHKTRGARVRLMALLVGLAELPDDFMRCGSHPAALDFLLHRLLPALAEHEAPGLGLEKAPKAEKGFAGGLGPRNGAWLRVAVEAMLSQKPPCLVGLEALEDFVEEEVAGVFLGSRAAAELIAELRRGAEPDTRKKKAAPKKDKGGDGGGDDEGGSKKKQKKKNKKTSSKKEAAELVADLDAACLVIMERWAAAQIEAEMRIDAPKADYIVHINVAQGLAHKFKKKVAAHLNRAPDHYRAQLRDAAEARERAAAASAASAGDMHMGGWGADWAGGVQEAADDEGGGGEEEEEEALALALQREAAGDGFAHGVGGTSPAGNGKLDGARSAAGQLWAQQEGGAGHAASPPPPQALHRKLGPARPDGPPVWQSPGFEDFKVEQRHSQHPFTPKSQAQRGAATEVFGAIVGDDDDNGEEDEEEEDGEEDEAEEEADEQATTRRALGNAGSTPGGALAASSTSQRRGSVQAATADGEVSRQQRRMSWLTGAPMNATVVTKLDPWRDWLPPPYHTPGGLSPTGSADGGAVSRGGSVSSSGSAGRFALPLPTSPSRQQQQQQQQQQRRRQQRASPSQQKNSGSSEAAWGITPLSRSPTRAPRGARGHYSLHRADGGRAADARTDASCWLEPLPSVPGRAPLFAPTRSDGRHGGGGGAKPLTDRVVCQRGCFPGQVVPKLSPEHRGIVDDALDSVHRHATRGRHNADIDRFQRYAQAELVEQFGRVTLRGAIESVHDQGVIAAHERQYGKVSGGRAAQLAAVKDAQRKRLLATTRQQADRPEPQSAQ